MKRFGMSAAVVGAVLFGTGLGAAPAFAETIPLEQASDTADTHAGVQPVVGGIVPVDSQSAGSRALGCLINKVYGC